MALRTMSVDIGFNTDLSAITRLDSVINNVVQSITGGMGRAENSVGDLGSEFRDLTRDASRSTSNVGDGLEDIGGNANDSERYVELLADSLKEFGKMSGSLEDISKKIEDIGKESKNAEKSTGGLAKKLGGGLAKGLAGVGVAAAGAVAGFLATGEAAQETMEDMGKLETAFTTSGFSAEAGMKSYQGLVGILGETDQSVEAANHLAKLTDNEQDLQKWTDICTGVYATFGDSLPIEGLTEAANETAKVGQVTGPLADALNWAGISEDEFNEKLAACNSEQERSQLITETLSGTYQAAADKYNEVNGALIDARQATANLSGAMASVGQVAMPITTALKNGVADMVNSMVPGLEEVGEGINGLLSGAEGAGEQLKSGLQSTFDGLLGHLTSALPNILNIGVQVITSLIQGILNALPSVLTTVMVIIPQITQSLLSLLPQLVTVGIQLIVSLLDGLGTMIPEIVIQIVEIIPQIVDALVAGIPLLIQGAITFLMAIVQALPTVIEALVNAIPQVLTSVIDALMQAIPQLLEGAITLFMAIVDAIPVIIETLVPLIPTIVVQVITALIQMLPVLLEGAITLFMAIVDAIPVIIRTLIPMMPTIVSKVVSALIQNLPVLLQGAITLFMALVTAIPTIIKELARSIPSIISAIVGGLSDGISEVFSVGQDIIRGLWNGINDMADWIGKKIKGFGEGVLGGIKSFFGIESPSRVMADVVGKNLALGIGEGFEDNMGNVNKAVTDAVQFDEPSISVGVNRQNAQPYYQPSTEYAGSSHNNSTITVQNGAVQIHISGNGNSSETATKVRNEIEAFFANLRNNNRMAIEV